MNTKELRIGNYVQVPAKTETFADGQKTEIQRACVVTVQELSLMSAEGSQIIHDADFDGDCGSEVEGIPITHEWLEKFGFEKIDPESAKQNKQLKLLIKKYSDLILPDWYLMVHKMGCIGYVDGEGVTISFGSQMIDQAPLNHITSVHQLQNLYFALTGKELAKNP